MPNHETSTYSSTSVCGGTAGERAFLAAARPRLHVCHLPKNFSPIPKARSNIGRWVRILFTATWLRTGYYNLSTISRVSKNEKGACGMTPCTAARRGASHDHRTCPPLPWGKSEPEPPRSWMDTRRRCPARSSPPQASSPRLACSRSRSLAKRTRHQPLSAS